MPNLLTILASPRGDYSVSRALAATFTEAFEKSHPDTKVVVRDLYKTELPWVDLPWIAGAYTPAEAHSPEMKKALEVSNLLVPELQAADHILFSVPMYNFSIPAIVKAYIDHICRVNVTFTPQYEGLLKGKKTTIIVASGGDYSEGSGREAYNTEAPYLKAVLGFIGLTDIEFVMAGGSSAISMGKITLSDFLAQHTAAVEAAAK